MGLIRTLFDGDRVSRDTLPHGLRELYDGELQFPAPPSNRPLVVGNFVSTIDGIVSFQVEGESSGGTISGGDAGDRFIMGLLRASADAVIVGASTVEDSGPDGLWIPEYTYPAAKALYAEYRRDVLRKPEFPLVVVVSGRGKLEMERAVFHTPGVRTVILTTAEGRSVLEKSGATRLGTVEIHTLDATGGRIDPAPMMQLLHSRFDVRVLLHEGGPTLFGQFLAAEAVDELFLTLSPQIGGRTSDTSRLAIVEKVEFMPSSAPWFRVESVKQGNDRLYLRYRRIAGDGRVKSA